MAADPSILVEYDGVKNVAMVYNPLFPNMNVHVPLENKTPTAGEILEAKRKAREEYKTKYSI